MQIRWATKSSRSRAVAPKEKFAKDLGAHVYVDGSKEDHAEALQKMGGADMIVSTAPNPEIMGGLVNGLGLQGKLVLLSREYTTLRDFLVCLLTETI